MVTPYAARTAVHRVVVADVMRTRTGSLDHYTVTSDQGAGYAVLGPVPGDPDRVYVIGRRHGNLALVTRTGREYVRGKGRQVRVLIQFAWDTGDADGTLQFDAACATGGVAPRVLFA